MGRLNNKIAVITGAGSGIGRAITTLFAKEGATLILVGRDEEKLKNMLRIEGIEKQAKIYAADVSSGVHVEALGEYIKTQFGTLDILVNNAGTILRNENMLETTEQEWDQFISINLKSHYLMCRTMIPFMQKNRKGSIINIASQLGMVSAPGYTTYSTAKGGIISFTRSLAIDFGSYNIRANCVSPGLVKTPMAYVGRENFEELESDIAKSLPLKRIGRPEDIAYAVLYLASDESEWVTGTNMVVDGGYTSK